MKKLTLSDYQALAEFRYQIRKFLRFSEHAVRAAGMEPGAYQLLLAIKGIHQEVRKSAGGTGSASSRRVAPRSLQPRGSFATADAAGERNDAKDCAERKWSMKESRNGQGAIGAGPIGP